MPTFTPIKITDLAEELPADEAFSAACMALEETALVQALVMIHGKERGYKRYIEAGGHIGWNSEGDLVIYWHSSMMTQLKETSAD